MELRGRALEDLGMIPMKEFYRGRKALVTGHTGFKGSWLCRILGLMGADVYGYALEPPTDPSLYDLLGSDSYVTSEIGDIADYGKLSSFYREVKPDIVFHLAAQPIVREGYRNPRLTYGSNVMGTVNILECVRNFGAESFLNITTDKVYENIEDPDHRYREDERLDGFDPYSNSKSCSELVTHSYVRSFDMCSVSTARAGNVIGGGDFASERIIPDCVRAAVSGKEVVLRNPNSVRPYQHVMEPLFVYLTIAMMQAQDRKYAGNYNIGPEKEDCATTGDMAEMFCKAWGGGMGWKALDDHGPHEANFLKLDNTKVKETFGIPPLWHVSEAIDKTVEWTRNWHSGGNVLEFTDSQIREYLKGRGIDV